MAIRWLCLVLLIPLVAEGQAKPPEPAYVPHLTFDVVTIRESGGGHQSFIDNAPKSSYFEAVRLSAWGLIVTAYEIKIGGLLKNLPEWADNIRLDLTAKSDDATDVVLAALSEKDFQAEKRYMLRQLLADRFKLQIHAETRIATTYELVSTERTARLMTQVEGDAGKGWVSCNQHFSAKGVEVLSVGCPFPILLNSIQSVLETDVVDHTGLVGAYAYHLMWSWPSQAQKDGEDRYPPLADALREQLGLVVKKTQGPVTFWVVDHIERPTAN